MPKTGPNREPRTLGLRSQPPAPPKKRWTSLSKVVAGLLGLATVLGGAAAVVTFLPRMTVDASGPFEASQKPPVSFTIANTNVIPLLDITPKLGLCAVSISRGMPDAPKQPPPNLPKCNEKSTGLLWASEWHHDRLGMDERFTATWDDAFHNEIEGSVIDYADIIITINYRPWILPWYSQKTFRFVTRKLGDNKLYWFARPLAD
jgi:hypothetical protein